MRRGAPSMGSRSNVVEALVAATLLASGSSRAPAIQIRNGQDKSLVLSNQAVAGEIAATSPDFRTRFLDSSQHGRPVRSDCWILETKAAGWVAFEARSRDFDVYLVVAGSGGFLAEDDDSGLATDARLRLALPANERFEVRVCALHEGAGRYELIARSLPADEALVEPPRAAEIAGFEGILAQWDVHPDAGGAWRAGCLVELATLLAHDGRLADAERRGREAVLAAADFFGAESAERARAELTLGRALRLRHCFAEAEPILESAVAGFERAFGPNDMQVADALMQLAILFHERSEFGRAEQLYARIQEIYEGRVPPTHEWRARLLNHQAMLARAQGRFAEARPLLERALAISRKTKGRGSRDAAIDALNLAAVHRSLGDFGVAESLLREQLEIARAAFGEQSQEATDCVANLAELCLAQAR